MTTVDTFSSTEQTPRLPEARGPLSAAVADTLRRAPAAGATRLPGVDSADPFGEDLAVALHTCYELHYRGLRDVDEAWEWDPGLLRLRAALERRFLTGLRCAVPGGDDVESALAGLLVEKVPGGGISHHLQDAATWWQLREYLAQRSIYHLKEADPQAWVIPRLWGGTKAALVAVEFDEYGGGRADRVHAHLFAQMLAEIGLSPEYLHYLDDVPAPAVSIVNLMSMLGLHRRLRGALVGQLAFVEITSPPGARRLVRGLERLGATPAATRFYAEHVEADAVHEQLMRRDVVGGLLRQEPHLAADVVFGIQAIDLLEDQLADHAMAAWGQGRSSLRRPLPPVPVPS